MRTERFTVNGLEVTAQFDPRDIDHIYIPLLHNLSDLQKRLGRRIVCFLAGPPASGKSTLCLFLERLGRDLGMNVQSAGIDGFHYPQDYLNAHTLGDTPLAKIKGAPETYDVARLGALLETLDQPGQLWPEYDRRIHDPIDGAIEIRADIVVVSQGGAPKDLNLYQTQKALDNAKHAIKKGGTIILVGSCREGLGEKVFEEWMTTAPTAHSLIERIGREFRLGGHKAAAIAMVLANAEIYLVSEMDADFVRSLFLKPYGDLQAAFDDAFAKQGPDATVLVMPYGGSTLPRSAE